MRGNCSIPLSCQITWDLDLGCSVATQGETQKMCGQGDRLHPSPGQDHQLFLHLNQDSSKTPYGFYCWPRTCQMAFMTEYGRFCEGCWKWNVTASMKGFCFCWSMRRQFFHLYSISVFQSSGRKADRLSWSFPLSHSILLSISISPPYLCVHLFIVLFV